MPPISNVPVAGGGQALQFQRFNPEQLQALEQLRSGGLTGLQALQGLSFDPIEQRARTQFRQQTIPLIAERFTGIGNNRTSGRFESDLGQAGAGLEEALASLRSQYGLQQHGNLLSQLGLGLQPTFETMYSPPSPGIGSQFASGFGQSLGGLGSLGLYNLLGGGMGAGAGGILGLLKQLLGGM